MNLHSSIILQCVIMGIFSLRHIKHPNPMSSYEKATDSLKFDDSKWSERWLNNITLDHFSYNILHKRMFSMRFLMNEVNFQPGGPIFFYTGNEGPIEAFTESAGIIWDIAPLFNATIIFAEHRFYGLTLPFLDQSFTTIENLGSLTTEQALADYAQLITWIKSPDGSNGKYNENTKVIAFGGSYGGMLSAWFRMKYPHVITGAWAASAPLLYFHGGNVDQGAFDNVTSQVYVDAGTNRNILANCWDAIRRLSILPSGQAFLNSHFVLDPRTPITSLGSGELLIGFFREAIEYMATYNYPYETDFVVPLPRWPVKKASTYMNVSGWYFTDKELVTYIGRAAGVYYNSTGMADPYCIDPIICGNTTIRERSELAWAWQECTEIVIDRCARGGRNDVFWDQCGVDSLAYRYQYCATEFGNLNEDPLTPHDWTPDMLDKNGISELYGLSMADTSNIILTQGLLDPWSSGGYKKSSPGVDEKRGIYVIRIPGAAHQLDLRTPNTCEPNTVHNARYQIVNILSAWIRGVPPPSFEPLPNLVIPNSSTECKDINYGYPWKEYGGSAGTDLSVLFISFIVGFLIALIVGIFVIIYVCKRKDTIQTSE